mmetsp:Transcript_142725/g.248888  ORF Transcript_142725/g.248888 Transcript_142725/m.248888 type:complete len:82 (+) Transcript_142725:54-299(+)
MMGVFLGQFRSPATLLFFGAIVAMLQLCWAPLLLQRVQSMLIVAAVMGPCLAASFEVIAASKMSLQPPQSIARKEPKKIYE